VFLPVFPKDPAWLRRIAVPAFIILPVCGILAQQAGRPQFEVTAVKLNTGCGGPGRGSGGASSPGRVTLECAELRDLILTAYAIYGNGANSGPRSFRMPVLGGPGWVDSDRFDIAAKAEGNPAPSQMYGPMLQALLEDRFQLKVHRETKELPVYFLTTTKGGPKLRQAREGSCVVSDINHPAPSPAPGASNPRTCGSESTGPEGTFDMYGATIADLCTQLAIRLDRDVIDKTGLAGMFDIHLEASRGDLFPRFVAGRSTGKGDSPPLAGDPAAGPSIFTALQQQLGLKLESGKGPADVIVIDRVEKPSAN
jgi:uncharacterized protein (TIGR03435 family)